MFLYVVTLNCLNKVKKYNSHLCLLKSTKAKVNGDNNHNFMPSLVVVDKLFFPLSLIFYWHMMSTRLNFSFGLIKSMWKIVRVPFFNLVWFAKRRHFLFLWMIYSIFIDFFLPFFLWMTNKSWNKIVEWRNEGNLWKYCVMIMMNKLGFLSW